MATTSPPLPLTHPAQRIWQNRSRKTWPCRTPPRRARHTCAPLHLQVRERGMASAFAVQGVTSIAGLHACGPLLLPLRRSVSHTQIRRHTHTYTCSPTCHPPRKLASPVPVKGMNSSGSTDRPYSSAITSQAACRDTSSLFVRTPSMSKSTALTSAAGFTAWEAAGSALLLVLLHRSWWGFRRCRRGAGGGGGSAVASAELLLPPLCAGAAGLEAANRPRPGCPAGRSSSAALLLATAAMVVGARGGEVAGRGGLPGDRSEPNWIEQRSKLPADRMRRAQSAAVAAAAPSGTTTPTALSHFSLLFYRQPVVHSFPSPLTRRLQPWPPH